MASIGSMVLSLRAETATFRSDLAKAQRDIKRFTARSNTSVNGLNRGFGALAASAKGFIGVFAATAGIRGIDQMLQSVANLADTADKLGLTAERLQELRFAAEQTGIASNTLDMAVQRFTRRLGEAAQGGGELKGTLDQYGISVADAGGRTRATADVMGDLADVIRDADSDAERLRIGFKAFDSEGVALVNVLRDGRGGLEDWTQAARDAGVVMRNDLVANGREVNREWTALTAAIKTQVQTEILNAIVQWRKLGVSMGLISENAGQASSTITVLERDLLGLRLEADATQTAINDLLAGKEMTDTSVPPDLRTQINIQTGRLRELIVEIGAAESRLARLRREEAESGTAPAAAVAAAPVDTVARDRIAGVTAELRFQAEQIARTNEVQRVYVELRRAGIEADSAAGREIRNLVERLQEGEREQAEAAEAAEMLAQSQRAYQEAVADAARATEDGMRTIRSSSEQALGGMARDLLDGGNAMDSLANAARSTVNAIISEFLRLAVVRPIIGSIFGAAGAGAGATSVTQATAPGGTGLLFAHGGSFIADGPGGTDAIAQRINVTKGERVTVETPAQQRAGSGGGVTINQSFDFRGADQGVFARAQVFKQEIVRETVEVVQRLMDSGGPMAAASGRRR